MNSTNATAIAPGLEQMFASYTAPGWLIFFSGTALLLSFVCGLMCQRFARCSTWTFQGCGTICSCCAGCLRGASMNCENFTNCYKNCVVHSYDCVTFAPDYIRAQNYARARRSGPNITRQLPVVKFGPDPFDL